MSVTRNLTTRRPLLGSLAATPWLRRYGEVLAVQALAVLMEDQTCRRAVSNWAATRLSINLPYDLTWWAESPSDNGRPDLLAGYEPGVPRLILEAKFDHEITERQLSVYLQRLVSAGAGDGAVLLLLVPQHRSAEGEAALGGASVYGWQGVSAVVTWDELLAALYGAAIHDAGLSDDLRQLRGLCETYAGIDIAPFSDEDLAEWPSPRLADLKVITDRVTANVSAQLTPQLRLLPIGRERDGTGDDLGYYRRYVRLSAEDTTLFSVGIRRPRQGSSTPLWLRFHTSTPEFAPVTARLLSAVPTAEIAGRGHLYIPLLAPTGAGGDSVTRALIEQVMRYQHLAVSDTGGASAVTEK